MLILTLWRMKYYTLEMSQTPGGIILRLRHDFAPIVPLDSHIKCDNTLKHEDLRALRCHKRTRRVEVHSSEAGIGRHAHQGVDHELLRWTRKSRSARYHSQESQCFPVAFYVGIWSTGTSLVESILYILPVFQTSNVKYNWKTLIFPRVVSRASGLSSSHQKLMTPSSRISTTHARRRYGWGLTPRVRWGYDKR